jgi:uncharacterized membrane protein
MSPPKPRRWILLLPVAVLVLQAALYWPRLPERLASHFDAAGHADGWSTKGEFFTVFFAFVGGVSGFFLLLSYGLQRVPAALISLPGKDYWLAPERREATYAFLAQQLVWFGFASGVFFVALLQVTLRANLDEQHRLDKTSFLIYLGGYLAFTLLWVIHFLVRFRRPR